MILEIFQARNKPADGGHVNQKGQSGAKALPQGQQNKPGQKPPPKPTAQKGQVKAAQPKAAAVKAGGKQQKKKKNQQYDLVVTINLVSLK